MFLMIILGGGSFGYIRWGTKTREHEKQMRSKDMLHDTEMSIKNWEMRKRDREIVDKDQELKKLRAQLAMKS